MVRNTTVLERKFFSQGQVIIEQDDEGDFAYLIQSGRVQVYAQKDGVSVDLAILKTGDIFGETTMLFGEPRTASVRALDDTTVIILTRQLIDEKVRKSDPTLRAIMRMLTARLSRANDIRVEHEASDVENIIKGLRRMFVNLLDELPEAERSGFRREFLPILTSMIETLDKYGQHTKNS